MPYLSAGLIHGIEKRAPSNSPTAFAFTPVVADTVGQYWAESDAIIHIEALRQCRPLYRPDVNADVGEDGIYKSTVEAIKTRQ